jgi:predicted DNA-binding transcriptional regulator AlpA
MSWLPRWRPARASSPGECARYRRAGADLAKVFHAPTTTIVERKQLIRAVIDHIVLTINTADRITELRIIWQGGASTQVSMTMTKHGGHTRTTSEDTVALVRRLAEHYDDTTIAMILSKQRRRTATGLGWTKTRVTSLPISHAIDAYEPQQTQTVGVEGQDDCVVTVPQAAELLGVSKYTIYRWLREGFIIGEQLTPAAPWHVRIDQHLRDRIRPEAPEGWLPLDQPHTLMLSGSPARPCCTKSNAANSTPSTSTAAAAKGSASRSNPTRLDCLTHPDERNAQC